MGLYWFSSYVYGALPARPYLRALDRVQPGNGLSQRSINSENVFHPLWAASLRIVNEVLKFLFGRNCFGTFGF